MLIALIFFDCVLVRRLETYGANNQSPNLTFERDWLRQPLNSTLGVSICEWKSGWVASVKMFRCYRDRSVHLRQVAVILRRSEFSGFIEVFVRRVVLAWRVFDAVLAHRVIAGHACDSKFWCAACFSVQLF